MQGSSIVTCFDVLFQGVLASRIKEVYFYADCKIKCILWSDSNPGLWLSTCRLFVWQAEGHQLTIQNTHQKSELILYVVKILWIYASSPTVYEASA